MNNNKRKEHIYVPQAPYIGLSEYGDLFLMQAEEICSSIVPEISEKETSIILMGITKKKE